MARSNGKYPLTTLATLRDAKVDASTRHLARAIAERQLAERARATEEARKDAHEHATAAVNEGERTELGRGTLHARDLHQLHVWQGQRSAERQVLDARVRSAKVREDKATGDAQAASDHRARDEADARVVDEHRARWTAERDRANLAAEEEAAAETWRSKR